MVTHHTTNWPACGLSTAERTGSPVLHTLWSYVLDTAKKWLKPASVSDVGGVAMLEHQRLVLPGWNPDSFPSTHAHTPRITRHTKNPKEIIRNIPPQLAARWQSKVPLHHLRFSDFVGPW